MPRNGNGVYSAPANSWNPAVANTEISETDWAAILADFSTAITNSIASDGQTTITANLPMDGFKFTGLGNGSARTDSAALGQLQDSTANWVVAGGTADAITATYSPAITALVDGQECTFRASAANTSATPTFAPNGLTARTIVKSGGVALSAGDIPGNLSEVILRYNLANTRWELLNPAVGAVANTWTPVLTFATPGNLSVSYSSQVGHYTRVGKFVFATFSIVTSAFTHTSASGNVQITGLPFTSVNAADAGYGPVEWQGITKAGYTNCVVRASPNTTLMTVDISGSAVGTTTVASGDMPTGGTVVLRGTVMYYTA